ncbi:hypothetical protein F4679DRAFT_583833 [Xylaria curta]|nr:hypothetical protein F4679DRAFT_583833 [Xylaria curta]
MVASRTALLSDLAKVVGIIKLNSEFTQALTKGEGLGNIFKLGLEKWRPDEAGDVSYDVIGTSGASDISRICSWRSTWCGLRLRKPTRHIGTHVQDLLLGVAEDGKVRGFIVKKIYTAGNDVFDEVHSSVTRQGMC